MPAGIQLTFCKRETENKHIEKPISKGEGYEDKQTDTTAGQKRGEFRSMANEDTFMNDKNATKQESPSDNCKEEQQVQRF